MDIGLALLIALILAAGGGILLIRRNLDRPNLVVTRLPPYEIPDVILVSGIVVENRAGRAASNVVIAVEYDEAVPASIHHMHIESEEPHLVLAGGEQHNFVNIALGGLGAGKRVFVYWTPADRREPVIRVTNSSKGNS